MPIHMKETNIAWLKELFRILEMDGVWVWPETDRVFQKVDKYHWIEIEDEEEWLDGKNNSVPTLWEY